ncbi:MAG TPA: M28 family metallopeptidase [Candidatus Sulfotelmatobacter sp.]
MHKIAALLLLAPPILLAQNAMQGFAPPSAAHEAATEARFKSIPSPDEERRQHRIFTAEPHVAGSKRNHELADYIASEWQKQGLEDVVIRQYDVYGTNPKSASLEMIAPVHYQATLREAPLGADSDSNNPNISGAWSGMSISGEATASLVYAHSGNPEDYELLRKHGISVKGKIVLVRYSNPYSYRGFKALTAQNEGAAAILIYSDPAEDGYKKGKVDPDGPWGPEYHIQRGAITYDFMVPGDPLTPGWASVPGAKRIPIEEAKSAPKIMALPLSWHDAKPLLEHMDGPVAPANWQGGLPIQYRLGGGRVRVHLKIEMENRVQPYYVVEGRIHGAELPDEWVVLGNHRDAWVFGGVDPSSGTASMMEMTRALGQLVKDGQRPRRTIVVCSWDGEEVGLTGSTEWGEQFAQELRKKAVAYINVDSSTSGPDFHGQAVASLAPMLVETSRSLQDPSGKSLYEAWKETHAREAREKKQAKEETDSNLSHSNLSHSDLGHSDSSDSSLADTRIGSGSDHTVFLNFVGIPVIGLQFDGPYGVYHSAYDDFYWMNHFGDPGYRYHTLMSQLWGVVALRLSNADLLPFDFASYAANIRQFVNELAKQQNISGHPRKLALTGVEGAGGPGEAQQQQALDLKPVLAAITEFESAGQSLNESMQNALASGKLTSEQAATLNHGLMQVERNWLNREGIPGRPWFKHILYGARYTYAHLELPGLTEAVEKNDWQTAKQQAEILRQALANNTKLVIELNSGLDNSIPTATK